MVTYKPEDLYAAGDTVQDFSKGLATAIANEVCELYQASPKGFVTGTVADAPSQFLRGYWDSFCGRLPEPKLPSPPSKQFTGGQCCDKFYFVDITYTQQYWDYGNVQNGPITGPFTVTVSRSPGRVTSVTKNDQGTGIIVNTQTCDGRTYSEVGFNDGAYRIVSFSVAVRTSDGSPDNCGDLDGDYPDKGLPAPTNPRIYEYPSPGVDPPRVPYSIDFDPTVVVPIVRVNGEVEVNPEINFDAGGISVEIPFNIGGEGDGSGISPEDLQALLDAAGKIPELQNALDDLTRNGDTSSVDKGEKEGESEEDVADIAGVVIQVTRIPPGYGRRFGKPELFDFGRIHFKRGDFYTQEVRISTVRQWCPAEPDSTGYVIALNKGVLANVTVVKKEKQSGG